MLQNVNEKVNRKQILTSCQILIDGRFEINRLLCHPVFFSLMETQEQDKTRKKKANNRQQSLKPENGKLVTISENVGSLPNTHLLYFYIRFYIAKVKNRRQKREFRFSLKIQWKSLNPCDT